MPHIGLGYGNIFRPGAISVHPYAPGVWAKVPPSRQAIAAVAAGNVTFARNQIILGDELSDAQQFWRKAIHVDSVS